MENKQRNNDKVDSIYLKFQLKIYFFPQWKSNYKTAQHVGLEADTLMSLRLCHVTAVDGNHPICRSACQHDQISVTWNFNRHSDSIDRKTIIKYNNLCTYGYITYSSQSGIIFFTTSAVIGGRRSGCIIPICIQFRTQGRADWLLTGGWLIG